jgi:hypothetical protein
MNQVDQKQTEIQHISSGYKCLLLFICLLGIIIISGISGFIGYKICKFEKDDTESTNLVENNGTDIDNNNDKIEEDSNGNNGEETDPYEGWKVYENQNYRFEVRYPSDWKDASVDDINALVIEPRCIICYLNIEKPGNYLFQVVINPTDGSLFKPEESIYDENINISGLDLNIVYYDYVNSTVDYMNIKNYKYKGEVMAVWGYESYPNEQTTDGFRIQFYSNYKEDGWEYFRKILQSLEFKEDLQIINNTPVIY